MLRNPSFPQPNLLSADQLFVDGILLPLDLLPKNQDPQTKAINSQPQQDLELASLSTTTSTPSKRWTDIFKKNEKDHDKDKGKKKEKKGTNNNVPSASTAELNINIWPFSRSRSAGNNGRERKKVVATTSRKVSSAPCSRSNSSGESKLRKWPNSPSRGGVHLGRSSPVWQVKRGGGGGGNENRRNKITQSGTAKSSKVINLNVPMCIGYSHHLSCRSDGVSGVRGGGDDHVAGETSRGGHLFSLRSLFTKKVY